MRHFNLSNNLLLLLHIMLLLPLSIRGFSSNSLPIHRILVPIAAGSEEIETTCITDVLTRFGAEGETLLRTRLATKPKQ